MLDDFTNKQQRCQYFIQIDGEIVPDPDRYTKEELAREIVRLKKENNKLNTHLKENALVMGEVTRSYCQWMEEAERQINLPIWERKKMPILTFPV